jgi:hypothetical protein
LHVKYWYHMNLTTETEYDSLLLTYFMENLKQILIKCFWIVAVLTFYLCCEHISKLLPGPNCGYINYIKKVKKFFKAWLISAWNQYSAFGKSLCSYKSYWKCFSQVYSKSECVQHAVYNISECIHYCSVQYIRMYTQWNVQYVRMYTYCIVQYVRMYIFCSVQYVRIYK